jgi:hypothetical protein
MAALTEEGKKQESRRHLLRKDVYGNRATDRNRCNQEFLKEFAKDPAGLALIRSGEVWGGVKDVDGTIRDFCTEDLRALNQEANCL